MINISDMIQAEYAFDEGLAGVMTWSIDTDDFNGTCGGPTYPLLRTLNHALHNRQNGYYGSATNAQSSMLLIAIASAVFLCRPF